MRLSQLVHSRVIAARAAFPLGAAAPMYVGIRAPEHGVHPCPFHTLLPHPQHDTFQIILRGTLRREPFQAAPVPFNCCWRDIREVLPFADELLKSRFHVSSRPVLKFGGNPCKLLILWASSSIG